MATNSDPLIQKIDKLTDTLNTLVNRQGSQLRGSSKKKSIPNIEELIKTSDLTQINDQWKKIVKDIKKSGNTIEKQAVANTKTAKEAIKKHQEYAKILKALKIIKNTKSLPEDKKIQKAQTLTGKIGDIETILDDIGHEMVALSNALNKLKSTTEETTESVKKYTDTLIAAAVSVGKEFYNVQIASMKYGTALTTQQIYQSRLMGMSHAELVEILGSYRQTIEAAGYTIDDFTNILKQSSHDQFIYSGDLKKAIELRLAAEKHATLVAPGEKSQAENLYGEYQRIQRSLNRSLGMTNEEFLNLTKTLYHSSEIQNAMFLQNKKEFILGQTRAVKMFEYLRKLNLMTDQAEQLTRHLASLAGEKDPRVRFKQAAGLQAVAGILGLSSSETVELGNLHRTANTQNERYVQLMSTMSENYQRMVSQGKNNFGLGMMISGLVESAGIQGLVEQFEPFTMQNFSIKSTQQNERPPMALADPTTMGAQGVGRFFSESIGKSLVGVLGIGAVLALLHKTIRNAMIKGLQGAVTAMSTVAGSVKTLATTTVSKIGGLFGSGLAAAKTSVKTVGAAGSKIGARIFTSTPALTVGGAVATTGYVTGQGIMDAYHRYVHPTDSNDSAGKTIRKIQAFFGHKESRDLLKFEKQAADQTLRQHDINISKIMGANDSNNDENKSLTNEALQKLIAEMQKQNNVTEKQTKELSIKLDTHTNELKNMLDNNYAQNRLTSDWASSPA